MLPCRPLFTQDEQYQTSNWPIVHLKAPTLNEEQSRTFDLLHAPEEEKHTEFEDEFFDAQETTPGDASSGARR